MPPYSSAARQQYQATTDRYGRYGSPSGSSCFAVGVAMPHASAKPLPDPQVADRPHIQAPQLEHQKHLGRPFPDSPDRREPGDHLGVALGPQPGGVEHHRPAHHLGRQILNGRCLAGGQANRPQGAGRQRQQPFRGDLTAQCGDQAPMDGGRRRAGQLLIHDRADQSREMGLGRRAHPSRTGLGDKAA